MPLRIVTPPAEEPVSLAEARAHLRVDTTEDDDQIRALIVAARQHVDGHDGWLGRALVTQTLALKLDRFPRAITVPLPPLQSVESIIYVDGSGTTQTLAEDRYTATSGEPAKIVPAYGLSWPETRSVPEAVTVTFTAGYGTAADVPAPIKAALLLHVGTLYRDRESVTVGGGANETPAYGALLSPYRVGGFIG
jgi:uncharacterized phiE125 gp8 family phage protein